MYLMKYAELRCEAARIAERLKKIEENAILEAFEISAAKGKNKVYEDILCKVVLTLRTKHKTEGEDEVLASIGARILKMQQQLAKKNAKRLAEIADAIAQLEAERDRLIFTPELGVLKNKYGDRRAATEYTVPGLTVTVSSLVNLLNENNEASTVQVQQEVR